MGAWDYVKLGGVLTATALLGLPIGGTANAHGDEMFQKMDANGDGKVSPEEHSAAAKQMFEMMDSNHDGKVTVTEMSAAHAKMAAMHKGEKADKGTGKELSDAEKIKALDTNADGVLTVDEHVAGAKMMFGKMDTDHDGYLTKAELTEGHAKLLHKSK